jgi:hypothetical protein
MGRQACLVPQVDKDRQDRKDRLALRGTPVLLDL